MCSMWGKPWAWSRSYSWYKMLWLDGWWGHITPGPGLSRVLILIYRTCNNSGLGYLKDYWILYIPAQSLRSLWESYPPGALHSVFWATVCGIPSQLRSESPHPVQLEMLGILRKLYFAYLWTLPIFEVVFCPMIFIFDFFFIFGIQHHIIG